MDHPRVTTMRSAVVNSAVVGAILLGAGLPLLHLYMGLAQAPSVGLGDVISLAVFGALFGAGLGAVGGLIQDTAGPNRPKPTLLQLVSCQIAGIVIAGVAYSWLFWMAANSRDLVLMLMIGMGLWIGRYGVFPRYHRRRQMRPSRAVVTGPPPGHPDMLGPNGES